MDLYTEFTTTLAKDLLSLCIGEKLGSGVSREVFVFAPNPKYVIKFEPNGHCFQNVAEYEVWNKVQFVKEVGKWFAPILDISPCGTILLQEYATPLINPPEKIPAFFTDIKIENWGMINKQPVCIDYGYHLLLEQGLTKRLKKAKWD